MRFMVSIPFKTLTRALRDWILKRSIAPEPHVLLFRRPKNYDQANGRTAKEARKK